MIKLKKSDGTLKMNRPLLTFILLFAAITAAFLVPKPKYTSLNLLKDLNIPAEFPGWRSIDVSKELNLKDDRYNFISDVFARVYQNRYGEQLLFLVLDAGNFHNPKVCYTSSGFSIKEMGTVKIPTTDKPFEATGLFMKRQDAGQVMLYWLCIDKEIVSWTGQKMTEFWASLFNQKKSGLMVRLEIPLKGRSEGYGVKLGSDFIETLSRALNAEQKEYLFGR